MPSGRPTPSYTVTFNANGGSGTMAAETDYVPTALTLNAFTRSGYYFTGWNTTAGGTGSAYSDGATYPFTQSATLYAQWAPRCLLHRDLQRQRRVRDHGRRDRQRPDGADAQRLHPFRLLLHGLEHHRRRHGQRLQRRGHLPVHTKRHPLCPVGARRLLHRDLQRQRRSGTMAAETDNVPMALTLNAFTRSGYYFTGWNTTAGGTGSAYSDGATYPFTQSATLYAQWAPDASYTVTFNANGGSGTMAAETDNVPTALTLNAFTRSGYYFTGWNTTAGGTGSAYSDGATYPFTQSATLYAQWAPDASGPPPSGPPPSPPSPPTVTGISPSFGPVLGGTSVSRSPGRGSQPVPEVRQSASVPIWQRVRVATRQQAVPLFPLTSRPARLTSPSAPRTVPRRRRLPRCSPMCRPRRLPRSRPAAGRPAGDRR